MAGVDERQAFAKLEALKDIRHKTISLEKTRVALLCDVGQMEEEERCLNEYRYSQVIVYWLQHKTQSIMLKLNLAHQDVHGVQRQAISF